MADQKLGLPLTLFWIDFHNVRVGEARKAFRKRLEECAKYGVPKLKVVFGTPDRFEGSIAEAILRILESGSPIDASSLPISFWTNTAEFVRRVPYVQVSISRFLGMENSNADWAFSPFQADFETDPWKRNLCENWYYPKREWHSATEVAARLGSHCSLPDLSGLLKNLDMRLVRRTSTGNVQAVHTDLLPSLLSAWLRHRVDCPYVPHSSRKNRKTEKLKQHDSDAPLAPAPAAMLPAVDEALAEQNTPVTSIACNDFSQDKWRIEIDSGLRHFNAGQYSSAFVTFEALVAPSHALGWRYEYVCLSNLGFVREVEHRLAEAREYYRRAQQVAEENSPREGLLARSAKWNLQLTSGESPEFPTQDHAYDTSPEAFFDQKFLQAQQLEEAGKKEAAFDLLQSAYALAKEEGTSELVQVLLLQHLSQLAYSNGDYRTSLTLAQNGYALAKSKLPEQHAINIALLMTTALSLRYLGDPANASKHFSVLAHMPGEVYPGFRALANTHLGTCHRMLGRLSDAELAHRKSVRIEAERGESNSWIWGLAQSNLGVVYREQNLLQKAEEAYRAGLAATVLTLGNQSRQSAEIRANLGMLFLAQGRLDIADKYLHESLCTRQAVMGPEHADTAHSLYAMSQLRSLQGRLEDALGLAKNALRIRSNILGDSHPSTLRARAVLLDIEMKLEKRS